MQVYTSEYIKKKFVSGDQNSFCNILSVYYTQTKTNTHSINFYCSYSTVDSRQEHKAGPFYGLEIV